MSRRVVVHAVLRGEPPPYVPWSFSFTQEARQRLETHYGTGQLPLYNHLLELGSCIGHFEPLGDDRYQDVFGVVWDRSVDKDIGVVSWPSSRWPTPSPGSVPPPPPEPRTTSVALRLTPPRRPGRPPCCRSRRSRSADPAGSSPAPAARR